MKISTDEENNHVLKTIELLMEGDPEPDTREGIALKTLAEHVQAYEKKYDL